MLSALTHLLEKNYVSTTNLVARARSSCRNMYHQYIDCSSGPHESLLCPVDQLVDFPQHLWESRSQCGSKPIAGQNTM